MMKSHPVSQSVHPSRAVVNTMITMNVSRYRVMLALAMFFSIAGIAQISRADSPTTEPSNAELKQEVNELKAKVDRLEDSTAPAPAPVSTPVSTPATIPDTNQL